MGQLIHWLWGVIAAWLGAQHVGPTLKESEDPRHQLGQAGEREAARYLKRRRWRILYRNYRAKGGGEVDLVCRDVAARALVFVEVKTRRTLEWGDPSSAVDESKQRLIIRGALEWLRLLGFPDISFRFDVVEVVGEPNAFECNLIENAFQLPDGYYP